VTTSVRDRRLYLCTPLRDRLEEFVAACLDGGVDVVQLREKHGDARDVLAAATELAELCRERSVPFLVNDRPDIALASGADGVHVGQEDVSVSVCRAVLGADAIVGLSTHSPGDLDLAIHEDVTYLSAGPVVATPTKPGRPPTGVDYVEYAVARTRVPVFVTGGVTPDTVGALVARGARHFVVVRAITESDDPAAAARALRDAIDRAIDAVGPGPS
jgi:thiamine-phosphate pyrophosphorylase